MSFSGLKIWCSTAELQSGAFFYTWYLQNFQGHVTHIEPGKCTEVFVLVWVLWMGMVFHPAASRMWCFNKNNAAHGDLSGAKLNILDFFFYKGYTEWWRNDEDIS